jgi:hypothetical protein
VPGVGVVVMATMVLPAMTTMAAVVTMNRLPPRLSDHVLFRMFRVAGLGGSGVVVIMTVVAMFVHVDLMREWQDRH